MFSGVRKRWQISEAVDYFRLIGRFSVISIGHTSKLFPTATGFLVSGFCFWVFAVTSTKSSRLLKPTKAQRAAPACMYLLLKMVRWTARLKSLRG